MSHNLTDYPDYTLPIVVIGTVTVTGSVTVSGAVTVTGTVAVSGTVTVSGIVSISGSVTVTGTVAISGSVTITGTVAISGTVTITGAVTITSGAVTITTVGGTNIVIDKLVQGAHLERRSILANDENKTPPADPSNTVTETGYIGKFFPRGCRGNLDNIHVYCKRTDTGTAVFSFHPYPGAGEIFTVTITPGASYDWVYGYVRKFWNYDSMFINLKSRDADVSIGVDSGSPPDILLSADSGATWYGVNFRLHVRLGLHGETVGDLPISGTVNTIQIPNATTARQYQVLNVPHTSELLDTIQYGSGELIIAIFVVENDNSRSCLRPRIYCDGNSILPFDLPFVEWHHIVGVTTAEGINFGLYDETNHEYSIIVVLPLDFKRSIQIGFYNEHATDTLQGFVGYTYKKIA